jgi:hypothetical protein|tara:strand:- start:2736 stop:2996 length:261 start_codon:yes stop_codon:yes gene_type:complete
VPPAARDIVFHIGDILYDPHLQDVGILLECYDSLREHALGCARGLPVWKMWWCRAGEEHYSEEGLQNLVDLDVFVCYSIVPELEKF